MGAVDSVGVVDRAQELPLALQPLLPGAEPTYRVSELGLELKEVVQEGFGSVWVVGEVQKVRLTQRGHLYFDLVEKGAGDEIVGRLEAVIWRTDHERVRRPLAASGAAIAEGLELRCRASLDFYPPSGKLQLVVREVDAVFSLGLLARRRRETLLALEEAGLLDLNQALELPALPLSIGLVTSEGSAAYHDFLESLRESGYGFRVRFVHASVQGPMAERELLSALATLQGACECVVVIRGGGSKTDLAAFDGRRLAEAVARCSVPVLAGLGHETDRSVVDEVAHTSLKTPTKVAEFLIARVREAEVDAERLRDGVLREASACLDTARQRLELCRRRLPLAGRRVKLAASDLAKVESSLCAWSRARVGAAESSRLAAAASLSRQAESALRRRARAVEQLTRWASSLSPRSTLARGYSITRGADGRALRGIDGVRVGERLITQLSSGGVESVVDAVRDQSRSGT